MAYIGNTPADKFLTLAKQNFSTSATTSYTLDSSVSSTQDIALFINSVRQSPVDAYTVSGTALTLTSATAGTDEMYCVYLGKTVGTVSPASDSVTTAMIQSNAVNNAKMADDAIGLAELSATGTPSSSNFLRGDKAWASAGGDNTPAFFAYASSNTNIASDTNTKIALNSEYYDTDDAFNTSDYRFTVPSGEGGKYQISFATSIQSDADKTVSSKVYINGSYVDIKGLIVYSSIVNTSSSASATSSAFLTLIQDFASRELLPYRPLLHLAERHLVQHGIRNLHHQPQ